MRRAALVLLAALGVVGCSSTVLLGSFGTGSDGGGTDLARPSFDGFDGGGFDGFDGGVLDSGSDALVDLAPVDLAH